MFGNFNIADIIAINCSNIDVECRKELERGVLVSERDYVTALTTRIRVEIGNHIGLRTHAQTLNPTIENKNGVDGIIVFKIGNEIKAGIFEAKRPQVLKKNHPWDYPSSRKLSHFSEQIQKQRKWRGQLAIWEMFFNEGPKGHESPPFEYFGSSCVWHDNAYNFMNTQGLIFNCWNTTKLKQLLSSDCVNFYTIIFDMISCKAGKKHKINIKDQNCRIFSELDDNFSMTIPLPLEGEIKNDNRIESFLLENNIDSYLFIDLGTKE
ncbi:hypothetical protein [Mariniflexile sp. AS56]|uniref:hypothetical protein n=1 Tax=Flavobacteriaceae TaxID=49546 RepID=UPI0026EE5168|nr:hypothetical protein [Mariniflexile sp. AS56]MDO7174181.1 hypothetical protein [Mariniflexile sp. AS56]